MRIKRNGLLLTAKDVANYLGISIKTAQKLMEDGSISSIKLPNETIRTTQENIDLFVKKLLKVKK